jgi:hypothetical protein
MRSKGGRSLFSTKDRVRLGLWGLGRGMNFYEACARLHLDIVAGCDFNPHMRESFHRINPDALVTDNADEFLEGDFDAVLLATYCPEHALDAIRCLDAGKHVLSEVTAFHTMAEGVRLVEAVERSGLVYNLAENYPFTAPHMYLARRWKEGLFGELMYAEGEYVHEVRSLCYTYIDGVPIVPGNTMHQWRSWLNFHYYCTHSLGPAMFITGLRPTRVVSLPGGHSLPGFPPVQGGGLGGIAPSLIQLDNGAVFKNLMGGTTNDTHLFRFWGTRGSAESSERLFLRLGGSGEAPKFEVKPDWGEYTALAETMGHGGGDFFVLYYFARHILTGEPAPFDIHTAVDVSLPGILAYRSAQKGGRPYDIPDFRRKSDRDHWRDDHFALPRYDTEKGCFSRKADPALTQPFTALMKELLYQTTVYRAYADWSQVFEEVVDKAAIAELAERLIREYPVFRETVIKARALADAYPRSDGAHVLNDMLEEADEERILDAGFLQTVKQRRNRMRRRKP